MAFNHGYRNHDVSRDTDFYYDDIVFSNSFIGTDGTGLDGNIQAAPMPPSGIR